MADNPADTLLKAIASLLQEEEKVFVASDLAKHLSSVETDSRFQYDPVARNVAAQVSKFAEKNPGGVVTAEQISKLYNELESLYPNSEFKAVYANLFPSSSRKVEAQQALSQSIERARHSYTDHTEKSDITIDEDQEFAPYSPPEFQIGAQFKPNLHRFAETALNHELSQFGVSNLRVSHSTNGPNFMIYTAQFVTPTGKHQVVVPIQVQNDTVVLPEVFGCQDRSYPFTVEGFKQFEKDNFEIQSLKANDAANLLRSAETNDQPRPMSAIERYINDDLEVVEDDELNLFKPADEVQGLEDVEAILANSIMRKQSSHDGRTINAAAEVLTRELRKIGQYKTPVFAGDGNHGDLLFNVQLAEGNRTAFVTIPVETQGSKILFPTHFILNKQAYQLDSSNVRTAFVNNQKEVVFDVETTDLKNANYKTLRHTVYASTIKNDHDRARCALETIRAKFGNDAFNNVVRDYQHWIVQAQKQPVAEANIQNDYGRRMSDDDWANSLQREIQTVTGSKEINVPEELDLIHFEKYDDPGFEGTIITNKIDGIELT